MSPKPPQKTRKHYMKIGYLDEHDKLVESTICFEKDYYLADISYRENMQDAACQIAEDGGFWLDEKRIVPFHRVRYLDAMEEASEDSDGKEETTKEIPKDQNNKDEKPQQREQQREAVTPSPKEIEIDSPFVDSTVIEVSGTSKAPPNGSPTGNIPRRYRKHSRKRR